MLGSSIATTSPNTLTSTAAKDVLDDILFTLGTDGDGAILNRSSTLTANTALTNVLIGTPVTPALAANSLIIANKTQDGDVLFAVNDGGNSQGLIWLDGSAGTLNFPLGVTMGDTKAINTGLANDDYFTIGAVDNDDNLIDEMMRFVGSATPHITIGAPSAYGLKLDPTISGVIFGDLSDSYDLLLRLYSANELTIRNYADDTFKGMILGTLRFNAALEPAANACEFRAPNTNDQYLLGMARDNDVGRVEIWRMQGAADPSFKIGNNGNAIEGTYAGSVGLHGATPVAQAAHIADSAGDDAAAVNAILVVLENHGLVATS